jgi:hypothetical protein
MKEKSRKNADPITGAPGAHPLGTGVGAAGGALTAAALGAAVGTVVGGIAAAYGAHGVAEAMNPTIEEEKYWREQHEKQSFVKPEYTYEHYAPAYRTGYEGFHKYRASRTKKSKAIWRSITNATKRNQLFRGTMLDMP